VVSGPPTSALADSRAQDCRLSLVNFSNALAIGPDGARVPGVRVLPAEVPSVPMPVEGKEP
jgi:hypothetical protein